MFWWLEGGTGPNWLWSERFVGAKGGSSLSFVIAFSCKARRPSKGQRLKDVNSQIARTELDSLLKFTPDIGPMAEMCHASFN